MKHFKRHAVVTFLLVALCGFQGSNKQHPEPWSVRMAVSEMTRTPDAAYLDFVKEPRWNYTNGLVCSAVQRVYEKTGEQKYLDYIKAYADKMIQSDGTIQGYNADEYNIDKVNSGKFLFALLKITGDEKYSRALHHLREQMKTHPRTSEGGFWHKQIYPHQMWLDGLYMGAPFLTQYAKVFNEPALYDDVALQIELIDKHTYDSSSGLFYHAWDEKKQQRWANKDNGKSPHVWGRAMGWFAMSLVDVLDYFPEQHPKRKQLLDITEKMARAIVSNQDKTTGVWYQVMDQPKRKGNYLEASASSMFTYFLIKGVNQGYINAKYKANGKKGYAGIIKLFIKEEANHTISLTQVCAVAGLGGNPYRDGSFEYYIGEPKRDNDPKGVGPFIMASVEMELASKAEK
jgi:unsaturated rhamnogalacturonyl hydrolase